MSEDVKDLIVLATTAAALPLGFYQPVLTALLWGWLGFLLPYGIVRAAFCGLSLWWLPVLATLAGAARRQRAPLPRSRQLYLLLAFWAFCALTTATAAVHPEIAWQRLGELSRVLVLLLVVMTFHLQPRRFRALLWVTALACGAYAVWGALWVLVTGGAAPLYGPRSSDAENNNDLAAMLLAVLPFFAYLGRASPGWLRSGMLGLFACTVIAVLGTYSRAAMLGLGAVWALLLACRRWPAVLAALAAFAIFLACTPPEKFFARFGTICSFRSEPSAAMRPDEWYVAWRVGLDHPWLGAGFRPFDNATYRRYLPDSTDYRDAHNLFLQVFAEHGLPGLALYTALLASTLWRLQCRARGASGPPGSQWIADAARMIQIGLVGYVVDAQFHCLSYRPLYFDLLILAMMLDAQRDPNDSGTVVGKDAAIGATASPARV